VLQLNASFEPLLIISAKRAMTLIVTGKAAIEVESDRKLAGGRIVPSVVRLTHFRRVPHMRVHPKSKNIFLRDGFTCQYCGVKFTPKELTLDHIKPRAQGGLSSWDNLVAACQPCNGKKADRTPEQAGMPLINRPLSHTIHTSRHMLRIAGSGDPNWRQFLYC
jgi:hypothetical protein